MPFGLALALAVAGCGGEASSGAAGSKGGAKGGAGTPGARAAVAVQAAREAALERTVTVTGTLAAEDQVAMGFKVAGRIETINVDLGSRVSPGQTIARLAPVDFQLRVQQAEAALQQARATARASTRRGRAIRSTRRTRRVVRQARAVLDEARLSHGRVKTFVDRGISSRAELDSADAALKVADGRYAGRHRGGPQPSGAADPAQDGARPGPAGRWSMRS